MEYPSQIPFLVVLGLQVFWILIWQWVSLIVALTKAINFCRMCLSSITIMRLPLAVLSSVNGKSMKDGVFQVEIHFHFIFSRIWHKVKISSLVDHP
jgi:hypothetical protein